MKHFLVGVPLLFAAATVHAEPAFDTPITARAGAPAGGHESYLAVGGQLGVDSAGIFLTPTLELGHNVGESHWLLAHAIAAAGPNSQLTEHEGTRFMLGGGLEARPCVAGGMLCGYAGLDLALRHTSNEMSTNDVVGLEHLGIDVGSSRLRLRLGVEAVTDAREPGLGLTTGLGWTF
jgi:hypothetical protein